MKHETTCLVTERISVTL